MIRIGIVDDHPIVLNALHDLVRAHAGFTIACTAASGREALDMVRRVRCDVLLLDLSMPRGSGLDVLASLRARAPDMAIVIFSAHAPAQYARRLLGAGAHAYLHKSCEPREILVALRAVAGGKRYRGG